MTTKFRWHLPMLLLLLLSPACRMISPKVPPELMGTWRTDDPRYENKFMTIDDEYVVLGLGEEHTPPVARITHITTSQEGPVTKYVIESADQQDHAGKLTVHYSPTNGGEIRLANQIVWKKDTSQPSQ